MPSHADDQDSGVTRRHIRSMLGLTPAERLDVLDRTVEDMRKLLRMVLDRAGSRRSEQEGGPSAS